MLFPRRRRGRRGNRRRRSASTRCATCASRSRSCSRRSRCSSGCIRSTRRSCGWACRATSSESVERVGVWIYVLFALAALPMLVPLAVFAIERSPRAAPADRRAVACSGIAVGVVARRRAVPRFGQRRDRRPSHRVRRRARCSQGRELTALYVVAACGALFACSYRDLAALGVLNLVAVPVLMWMTVSGFISLWCFWAAIVSVVIDIHLRRVAGDVRRASRSRARAASNVT